jgi:predicted transcriptional regulator
MSTARKFYTGVGLDPEVVQFLSELGRETQRTRSWLINAIVSEQARRLRLEREAQAAALSHQQSPTIRM